MKRTFGNDRPTAPLPPALPGVLTVVAGAFVAVGSWVVATVPRVEDAVRPYGGAGGLGYYLAALLGVVGSAMLLLPRRRRALGIVVLGLTAASVPVAFGGVIVGLVLGVTGGGLAVTTRPHSPTPPSSGTVSGRAPPWS